jgi:serine/threonine-protein kinase
MELPSHIGRYRIEALLGSGSMGNVYLAHDAELGRPVAVKTLRDVVLDEEMRQIFLSRFQNEARAAALLHHPNIVQIFDVGDDPQLGPYLVFEYVEGHTLKKRLKKDGPLEREELLDLAQQVGDALATAHVAGVIHRDLKPENLLITGNGQVKLADFGIARVPNADLTKEGQFLGTPCYSAPETLRGGEYSEQSDLFSFGAVLYEAVSGERAFPGTEAMAVAHSVMNREPVPPSEANRGAAIPTAVDVAIMRALSKTPGTRYASARTLVSALREAYEGRAPRSAKRKGRGRLWLVATLVTLVAVLIVLDRRDSAPPTSTDTPPELTTTAPPLTDTTTESDLDRDPGPDPEPVTQPGPDREAEAVMSPHEREEAAKDQLARARAAIQDGDMTAASNALDAASELDPSNPDIDALRAEVADASGEDG